MNAMEGRTREALHRVADRLILSDHDLERMEENLMTLLEARPAHDESPLRRHHAWAAVAAAAAAAVLALVGGLALWQANRDETPPTRRHAQVKPAVTPSDLVGVWTFEVPGAERAVVSFAPDGTSYKATTGWVDKLPATWAVSGDRLSIKDGFSPFHNGGTRCAYTYKIIDLTASGTMSTTVLNYCGETRPQATWVRLSPASAAGQRLRAPSLTGAAPVSDLAQASGIWLHQGTGLLLAIDTDAAFQGFAARTPTYRVDDAGRLATSPLDEGTVRLDGSGRLTLTSELKPQGCGGGPAKATLVPLVAERAMRATLVGSSCGLPLPADAVWIKVSEF